MEPDGNDEERSICGKRLNTPKPFIGEVEPSESEGECMKLRQNIVPSMAERFCSGVLGLNIKTRRTRRNRVSSLELPSKS